MKVIHYYDDLVMVLRGRMVARMSIPINKAIWDYKRRPKILLTPYLYIMLFWYTLTYIKKYGIVW